MDRPKFHDHRDMLSIYSQKELDVVAVKLNTRPRKTLAFATPADRFAAIVASTP